MRKQSLSAANARYTALVEQLLADMGRHNDDILNRKPTDGGWSAIQTLYHLILAEEGSLKYIGKKMQAAPASQSNTGIATAWRRLLIRLYLRLPFKFKAPQGVGLDALPEYATLAETRERWLSGRDQWKAFFEGMPEPYTNKAVYRHPIAGRMSWEGMLDFFVAHLARHRGQIDRALA
jgi:uncharacterized damage-inducible protein DinB